MSADETRQGSAEAQTKAPTMTVAQLRKAIEEEDDSTKVCLLVGSTAYAVSSATGDENGNWLIIEAGKEIPFTEDDNG